MMLLVLNIAYDPSKLFHCKVIVNSDEGSTRI